jgi:hypothetical protein
MLGIFLLVKNDNRTILLSDPLIIALLRFASFDCLLNPLLKFVLLRVITTVESELKYFFTLPELLRSQPLSFSPLFRKMVLVCIIVTFNIPSIFSGVPVLIEEIF